MFAFVRFHTGPNSWNRGCRIWNLWFRFKHKV